MIHTCTHNKHHTCVHDMHAICNVFKHAHICAHANQFELNAGKYAQWNLIGRDQFQNPTYFIALLSDSHDSYTQPFSQASVSTNTSVSSSRNHCMQYAHHNPYATIFCRAKTDCFSSTQRWSQSSPIKTLCRATLKSSIMIQVLTALIQLFQLI